MYRLRSRWAFLAVAIAAVLAVPSLLLATQAPDSSATIPTPGEGVAWLFASGITIVSMLLTKAGKWIAAKIDGTTAEVDEYLTKLYKPFQPVVAMGLALLLAKVHFLQGSVPSGEVLAAAPLTTILGVSFRELYLKYFGAKK